MIDYSEASISNIIVHRVSVDEAYCKLSKTEFDFSDDDAQTLKKIFLKPFTNLSETYEFKHEINIELNTLFKLSGEMREENTFLAKSKDIYQHLINVSKHPNIKDGDLFIVKYSGLLLGEAMYDGIGIYKVENKESFIETDSDSSGVSLSFKEGIGTRKLDKACLVLFTNEPYTVFIIDNTNVETDYWKNEFIQVGYKDDYVNSTNQFLNLTKSFITEQFPSEYKVTKADQIDLLNRSVEYFKTNDTFEKDDFEQEVFQDTEIIKSFRSYDEVYNDGSEIDMADSFEISKQAVKKQARVFKSVLKLDKNFHIYIHGDRDLIEQGVDTDGRKFYKIYYQDER